jgi:DNA-binding MarR family transcriptional regulator
MTECKRPDVGQLRKRISQQIRTTFQVDDTSGLEVFASLDRVARLSDVLEGQSASEHEVSGPRWQLLLLLYLQEKMGKTDGLTPTVLSHSQRVSKNTISSLLRGLEDQGFIQRDLDPKDLRIFHIRLSATGRELVQRTAPGRIQNLNGLLSEFSPEEIEQLMGLLDKLMQNILAKLHNYDKDPVILQTDPE